MPCDLDTIQAAACESGFGHVVDEVKLLQIIAQNSTAWVLVLTPEADVSPDAISQRACESGIGWEQSDVNLYRVIASNLCGMINPADLCDEPPAPTAFTVDGVFATTATLSWSYGADPTLGFKIYYGTTPGGPYPSSTPSGLINPSVRTFGLTGLTGGTTYYAVIIAQTTTTCFSADSNEVTFTTS